MVRKINTYFQHFFQSHKSLDIFYDKVEDLSKILPIFDESPRANEDSETSANSSQKAIINDAVSSDEDLKKNRDAYGLFLIGRKHMKRGYFSNLGISFERRQLKDRHFSEIRISFKPKSSLDFESLLDLFEHYELSGAGISVHAVKRDIEQSGEYRQLAIDLLSKGETPAAPSVQIKSPSDTALAVDVKDNESARTNSSEYEYLQELVVSYQLEPKSTKSVAALEHVIEGEVADEEIYNYNDVEGDSDLDDADTHKGQSSAQIKGKAPNEFDHFSLIRTETEVIMSKSEDKSSLSFLRSISKTEEVIDILSVSASDVGSSYSSHKLSKKRPFSLLNNDNNA